MSPVWDSNKELCEDFLALFERLKIEKLSFDQLSRYDQIHAGGLAATESLIEKAGFSDGYYVLELGGGIGGVARLLACRHHLIVVNIDLSFTYTYTGKKLSELCGEYERLFFVNADALFCPLREKTFDMVWLQHVGMNICDKDKLFSEIRRLLKEQGGLIFHEWFLNKSDTEVILPLPWADDETSNHLCDFNEFLRLSEKYGFKLQFASDETEKSLKFYKKLLEHKSYNNPVFKKRNGKAIFTNTVKMLESGTLSVLTGKLIL